MRWQYYPTTFVTLLVGISISIHKVFSVDAVMWMILGNFLLHCACSLINEYRDFVKGADLVEYPEVSWKATGGSKVLVDHLIRPGNVLIVSLLLFSFSSSIFVFLALKQENTVVLMVTFSLGVTFLYSAAVSKGGFYYIREVLLTLGAVPLFVVSVVRILSGEYSLAAVTAGIVVGILMMNYLVYHGMIDIEADKRSGKLRFTRVLGLQRTLQISELLTTGAFVILAVSLYFGVLPRECILCLVLIPLAVKILFAEMRKNDLLSIYKEVVLLLLVGALLLSAGFWLS